MRTIWGRPPKHFRLELSPSDDDEDGDDDDDDDDNDDADDAGLRLHGLKIVFLSEYRILRVNSGIILQ